MRKLLIILLTTITASSLAMQRVPGQLRFKIKSEDDPMLLAACKIINLTPKKVKAEITFVRDQGEQVRPRYKKIETVYYFVERDSIDNPIYFLESSDQFITRSPIGRDRPFTTKRIGNWKHVKNPKNPTIGDTQLANKLIRIFIKKMEQKKAEVEAMSSSE